MDRTITLDAHNDYLSKDGQIIRFARLGGHRYRMRALLQWARTHGFTTIRASASESPKRSWSLVGTGPWAGWVIQCTNRSNPSTQADWFQERGYAIFYNDYNITTYFPANGGSFERHQAHLVDLLIEGVLPSIIRGRTRRMERFDHTPATAIVLDRAA